METSEVRGWYTLPFLRTEDSCSGVKYPRSVTIGSNTTAERTAGPPPSKR
jgi:hypothetical protein